MDLPKVLVVAPISGHFHILQLDLLLGLLPFCQLFITDWVNARQCPSIATLRPGGEHLLRRRSDGNRTCAPNGNDTGCCRPAANDQL